MWLSWFLVAWLVSGCTAIASPLAPAIDPAVRVPTPRGSTRVVLELRLPGGFTAEGALASQSAVLAQRRAIEDVQQEVIARLAGSTFTIIRRYSTVPSMALEIGPDALLLLEGMGDIVTRVTTDALMAPQGPTR